jgi:hypothetical protein
MKKLVLGVAAATLLVTLPVAARQRRFTTDGTVGGMIGGIPAWIAIPISIGSATTVVR